MADRIPPGVRLMTALLRGLIADALKTKVVNETLITTGLAQIRDDELSSTRRSLELIDDSAGELERFIDDVAENPRLGSQWPGPHEPVPGPNPGRSRADDSDWCSAQALSLVEHMVSTMGMDERDAATLILERLSQYDRAEFSSLKGALHMIRMAVRVLIHEVEERIARVFPPE